jgi:hypothetical protein
MHDDPIFPNSHPKKRDGNSRSNIRCRFVFGGEGSCEHGSRLETADTVDYHFLDSRRRRQTSRPDGGVQRSL